LEKEVVHWVKANQKLKLVYVNLGGGAGVAFIYYFNSVPMIGNLGLIFVCRKRCT